MTREEAQALIDDGAQLVDVRVGHEWEVGHIAGATHLPLEELSERGGELDPERAGRPLLPRRHPLLDGDRGPDRRRLQRGQARARGSSAGTEAGLALDPEDGYVAESGEAAAILQARKRAASGTDELNT